MNKQLFLRIMRAMHIAIRQPGNLLESLSKVNIQVNLLAVLVAAFIISGFKAHFFAAQSLGDKTIAVSSLLMLFAVVLLNIFKRYEPANVMLYISFNIISLVAFRDLPGGTLEGILIYVVLLSLPVCLFQSAITIIICMCTILFRIIFFELHTQYIDPVSIVEPSGNVQSVRAAFDHMMLTLIVLVFILYGLKLYITERKQKRNALFTQHMSHDVQASYSSVGTLIDYLKLEADRNHLPTALQIIVNQLANASAFHKSIVNNFVGFFRVKKSRIESNHYETIDLESELKNIIEIHTPMAKKKNINISLIWDSQLPVFIRSDKIKVERIVLNLLTNAINNTIAGRKITISVRWKGGPWELSVANEGEGLSPEEIRHLFLPYEPRGTPSTRKRLGLSSTKQMVDALGGRITATSQLNHETLFTVAFPFE